MSRCDHVASVAVVAVVCCTGDTAHVAERTASWSAEPTVRAGTVDGPGALAEVFSVAVGPGGEIVVGQPVPPTISVFDPEGRFVRTLGRSGPGPGEFRTVGGMGWTGQRLWVIDFGRLHLFDSGFDFVRTLAPSMPDPPVGMSRIIPGALMSDGSILGIPVAFGPVDTVPLMLVEADGSGHRVIGRASSTRRSVPVDVGTDRPVVVSDPWPDLDLWVNADDGNSMIVVERAIATEAEGAMFRIVRIGVDGDTLVDRPQPYAPIPLEEAVRDRVYRSRADGIAHNRPTGAGAVEGALRENLPAPPFLPPVTQLIAGRDGTIWLRREEARTDSVDWDVFDASGEALGRVRLGADITVQEVQTDRIWTVVRDSFDVSFVQVHQISSG